MCLPLIAVERLHAPLGLTTFAIWLEHFGSGFGTTILFAALMSATRPADAGLHYTILTSANALAIGLGGLIGGILADRARSARRVRCRDRRERAARGPAPELGSRRERERRRYLAGDLTDFPEKTGGRAHRTTITRGADFQDGGVTRPSSPLRRSVNKSVGKLCTVQR